MPDTMHPRQRRIRLPITVQLAPEDLTAVDRAAAIRDETRASYVRRILSREANADIREYERKQQQAASAA